MPEISLRAEQMPASPIRKLVPLADAARARGTKIYHLNIGQPDLPSPKEGLESLKHIDRKVLEYSPSDGYRSLREKLVTYYEQYQIKLSPEEIIVTTGAPRPCSSPSCRASTRATKSSFPNRPTPTTWPSPFRRAP